MARMGKEEGVTIVDLTTCAGRSWRMSPRKHDTSSYDWFVELLAAPTRRPDLEDDKVGLWEATTSVYFGVEHIAALERTVAMLRELAAEKAPEAVGA